MINKVSGVKLLQGDLAEAWRENNDEYATVAMRFSLIDVPDGAAEEVINALRNTKIRGRRATVRRERF